MNLGLLLADLYRRTNQPVTPPDAVQKRYTAYLNETLQEVLSEPGLSEWIARNEPPVTFASVANRAVYALPAGVGRIVTILDPTNRRTLESRSVAWWRSIEPDPTTQTGTPDYWVPLGMAASLRAPATASGLWAVSSSSFDTTILARVETVRTGGVLATASTTLNGISRIQFGTATDHEGIGKFYLGEIAQGDVSLYDAATSGNLLATIPAGQTYSRYTQFALYPTPAAAQTYHVECSRPLAELINPTDEPPFPERFHRILIDGALWREYEKTKNESAVRARKTYENGVKQLRYHVTCPSDFLPVAGRSQSEPPSRLGAWFGSTRD